ncbi:MAG: MYXO-CTERM domain-containing protein [Glaciecola sp.]|jgi:MYXO-CTERM domain-containing protein
MSSGSTPRARADQHRKTTDDRSEFPMSRHRRGSLTAGVSLLAAALLVPGTALGQDAVDPTDPTFLSQLDNARVFGTVTPPGNELDDLETDLVLYDDLVYDYESVTAENLTVDYFKDGLWGPVQNPDREYKPRADVKVIRDQQGVPHIYGDTDVAMGFGAGFVTAEDRLPTLVALRALGRAETFELAAHNANWLADAELVRLYGYTEAEFQAQLDRLPDVYGPIGQEMVDLTTAFAAGINQFIVQAQSGEIPLPASSADYLPQNTVAPFTPTDIVAVVAIVRALFGADGGNELAAAARYLELVDTYGEVEGKKIYEDFRNRVNFDGPLHTLDESFSYMEVNVEGPTTGNAMSYGAGATGFEGMLREIGSIIPGTDAAALTPGEMAANLRELHETSRIKWENIYLDVPGASPIDLTNAGEGHLSNLLIAGGSRTETGNPILLGGPQTGYLANQILSENVLHSPTIHAAGASFPGLSLAVIGRNENAAWSATAGGSDMIDTYVNPLCDPDGGTVTEQEVHYLFDTDLDGTYECIPMDVRLHRETTTLPGGELLPAIYAERTIQGPVVGRGLFGDIPVAVSRKRSTYGKELDPGISILLLNKGVDTAQGFLDAFASGMNLATNWGFVSDTEIAYFHGGLFPFRPQNIHPDFPVWGTGEWEWELAPEGTYDPDRYYEGKDHPQESNPERGYIVSWNNRQAPNWGEDDSGWGFSSIYRADLLEDQIVADGVAGRKITPSRLTSLMEHAGLSDLRGALVVPIMLDVMANAPAPSQRAQQMHDLLAAWAAPGGPDGSYAWSSTRRDKDRDGFYEDNPAIAIIDAWWTPAVRAIFEVALGQPIESVSRQAPIGDAPSSIGSAFQGGLYGQVRTDLDQLLGKPIISTTSQTYCGSTSIGVNGTLAACAQALWTSLDVVGGQIAADQGSEDPLNWGVNADAERIQFTFVAPGAPGFEKNPVVPSMHWVNRPTTQTLAQFGRRTPVKLAPLEPVSAPSLPLPVTGGGFAALAGLGALFATRRRSNSRG